MFIPWAYAMPHHGIGDVDRSDWAATITDWQEKHPLRYEQAEAGTPLPLVTIELRAGTVHIAARSWGRTPKPMSNDDDDQ